MYNKVEDNFHLANKKALLLNMRNYYEALDQNVFDNLPVTFHIKNGLSDPEFQKFKTYYDKADEEVKNRKAQRLKRKHDRMGSIDASPEQTPEKAEVEEIESLKPLKNIWILKPGENTNCGNGI